MDNYNADSIAVLSDIQHIRKRPGMYAGEMINPAQLFSEILDNSVDELQNNYGSKIEVFVDTNENTYAVRDRGRGIPIGKKILESGEEKEVLEIIFTIANSGGKFDNSSYSHSCFTGDTRIKLADNRDLSIDELYKEFINGKDNYCYSINNETHEVIIEKISDVRVARKTNELALVTLDNGEVIKCTPDHRFITRDYELVEAKNLEEGQSLLPGYFKLSDERMSYNHNMIYDHSKNDYILTYYLADNYNLKNNLYEYSLEELTELKKYYRHHKDFDKLNDNPSNIERVTWKEHSDRHVDFWRSEDGKKQASEQLTKYNKSEKGHAKSRELGLTVGTNNLMNYVYSEANSKDKSERMTNMNKDPEIRKKQQAWMNTEEGIQSMRDRVNKRNKNPDKQAIMQLNKCLKVINKMITEEHLELTEENYINYKRTLGKGYNCIRKFDWVLSRFNSIEELKEAAINYNHKVVSVEIIQVDPIDVYDITICEEASNFLLSSGVFVKNCGLHGVGGVVTNALSLSLEVITYRDNQSVRLYCEDGEVKELIYGDQNEDTGTYVKFKPDPQFFESEIIPESYIVDRCKTLKAFGYDIDFYKNGVLQEFNIESIYDLLPKSNVSYCRDTIKFTSSCDEDIIVAFDYTSDTHYNSFGYTNLTYNRYGGTHTNYIYNAICDAWSEFNKEVNTELKYDDCTLGLNVLVAVFIGEIAFSSQTKEKLTIPKKNLDELMEGFKSKFIQYLKDNPELRKGLLKRFEEYRISQNKLLSQKEIMNLVVKNKPTSDGSIRRRSVVPNLKECTSTNREGTELYLVEGNSASGPLSRARDRRFQAVLPLRGKIKNVTYMDLKDIVKFDTVRNIINAIGAGCGTDVDSSLSRYEKIMILTDRDIDGAHIAALILSLLVTATPNLVKDGLVYIVKAPLYGYDYNGKRCYTSDYNSIPDGYTNFTRYKGLGEMDDTELRDTCLIPNHREIYQVQYPNDIDKFNEVLGTSSGRSQLLKDLNILVNVNSSEEVNYEVQD